MCVRWDDDLGGVLMAYSNEKITASQVRARNPRGSSCSMGCVFALLFLHEGFRGVKLEMYSESGFPSPDSTCVPIMISLNTDNPKHSHCLKGWCVHWMMQDLFPDPTTVFLPPRGEGGGGWACAGGLVGAVSLETNNFQVYTVSGNQDNFLLCATLKFVTCVFLQWGRVHCGANSDSGIRSSNKSC
jgi:hypothetical protein